MDLSQFKSVDVVNKKKPGGLPAKTQEYDNLKYRKAKIKKGGVVAKFYVSDKRWAELGLETNTLRPFENAAKNDVILAVVTPENGQLLKAREGKKKGQAFKSDIVEAILVSKGVLDGNAPVGTNQFVDMISIGKGLTIDGIPTIEAFTLAKGVAKPKEESTAPSVADTKATVASTPGAPVAATAAAESDWN